MWVIIYGIISFIFRVKDSMDIYIYITMGVFKDPVYFTNRK